MQNVAPERRSRPRVGAHRTALHAQARRAPVEPTRRARNARSGARTGPRGVFWDAFPRRAENGQPVRLDVGVIDRASGPVDHRIGQRTTRGRDRGARSGPPDTCADALGIPALDELPRHRALREFRSRDDGASLAVQGVALERKRQGSSHRASRRIGVVKQSFRLGPSSTSRSGRWPRRSGSALMPGRRRRCVRLHQG